MLVILSTNDLVSPMRQWKRKSGEGEELVEMERLERLHQMQSTDQIQKEGSELLGELESGQG